ncbi:MAG: calcium/sodium antiporter [Lachnospiraceae bacterium]|nr:calcium/sodium antiporter [Lachnospiraceae bacterium]
MEYLLLVVGFVLLVKGADFFVDGSSGVAKLFKVPTFIIGMTIVAMGTSLPETSVSITAAVNHNTGVALGNAVGSNIFNLMIVLGFCALFTALPIEKKTLEKEYPFSVLVALVLAVLGVIMMTLGHLDGIILLLIFVFFIVWMVKSALKARAEGVVKDSEEDDDKVKPIWLLLIFIIGGIAAIAIGGKLVVSSASKIAINFGMSDNLVGLTIVAFGTSLPELVTSAIAAKKKQVDMAIGNVIGSNIYNILLVLGISAAISPMRVSMENIIDIVVLVVFSVIVWIFCWSKKKIARLEGIIMIVLYAAYCAYIFNR